MTDPTTAARVATRAGQILADWEADRGFAEFHVASLAYSDEWKCFAGFPVVSEWSLDKDVEPLFREALRALAIKSAVFLDVGDERAAEVPIAVPVDEMVHALLAQVQLFRGITDRTGAPAIHQTDQERFDYHAGCVTHAYYTAAWGEEPPPRYWLDHHEVEARRAHLGGLYEQIGMHELGRHHSITFVAAA